MKERLRELSRNKFLRNVSTLVFGTVISQGIVIASSPLLTRLYNVEAFGLLSVFTSVTIFFAVVSTGRYELAIGLPIEDKCSIKIIRLIIFLGFIISLFYLLIIIILKDVVEYNDKTGFLNNNTSYLAPLYVFFIALYSALSYWNQRNKKYKLITISNAIQVVTVTAFSIYFGMVGLKQGMIFSLLIGIAVASLFILIKERLVPKIWKEKRGIFLIAKEYKSFPRFMIFSDLSLTATQQFIPLLFSILYSTTVVGLYALANRMIRLPNIVITSSIANVFRNDAIDEIREKGNCKDLYLSTLKKLVLLSIPIYVLVFIFSPILFALIFGSQWELAGHFARILSTMLLFEFVTTPLNTLFYVRDKQKILMRIQFVNAVFGALSIYLGAKFFKDPLYSLGIFSANAIMFNIIFLILSYRISKND